MKKFLAILAIISFPAVAEEFNVDQFMRNNGLNLFNLDMLGDRHHFENQRFVLVENGELKITSQGENTNRMSYSEDGFSYKGTNNGEWGGVLKVTKDGITKELMSGNIVHLLPIDDALYVIEGLAHLSMNGGSISIIPNRKEPTEPQRITLLPDAPQLVYVDNIRPDYQKIIIVGSNSVMALSPFEQFEILYWKAFWAYRLMPTSMVRYKGYYFIGLSHGVAVLPALQGSQDLKFYADTEFKKGSN